MVKTYNRFAYKKFHNLHSMLCLDLYAFLGLFTWNNGDVCLCINWLQLTCRK
jgi:hypothetical protein